MIKGLQENKFWSYSPSNKVILWGLFVYAFIVVFFSSQMSPLYPINDWSDVNLYFTIGKGIFNGIVPYTEAFDHKGPLIFLIYGIGYLFSHTSFLGVFIILVFLWFLALYFSYKTAMFFLPQGYSFLVALAAPIFMLSHTLQGGSAEEFILFAIIASLYLFVKDFKDNKLISNKHIMVHGILFSCVLLIKINLIVFWFFPLLGIFIYYIKIKKYKKLIFLILYFLLGIAIIMLPICLYFFINGALEEVYNIYIKLNSAYARLPEPTESIRLLLVRIYQRLKFDTYEFITILLGSLIFPFLFIKNRFYSWGICLAFWSLYVVVYISEVFVYYYAVPYYAFVIPGSIVIGSYLSKFIKIKFQWHICLFIFIIASSISSYYKDFFGYSNEVIVYRQKDNNDFLFKFEEHINKIENPSLINLSLDRCNTLFTLCDILPKRRYFTSPNLSYSLYPQMRDQQAEYIKNKEVDFVLLSTMSFNYEFFSTLPAFKQNYSLIEHSYVADSYGGVNYYLYKKINK